MNMKYECYVLQVELGLDHKTCPRTGVRIPYTCIEKMNAL